MDVAALHYDVVKRWNVVPDGKHHAPHRSKSQKEADGGDEQPAPRTVGNPLAHNVTQARAIKEPEQHRHQRQKSQEKNPLVRPGHCEPRSRCLRSVRVELYARSEQSGKKATMRLKWMQTS